jgi:hypothetical protein
LRSHVLKGASAHLFILYTPLCDILCAVAKSGRGGGPSGGVSGADGDEEKVIDLIRDCLARIGQEIGM